VPTETPDEYRLRLELEEYKEQNRYLQNLLNTEREKSIPNTVKFEDKVREFSQTLEDISHKQHQEAQASRETREKWKAMISTRTTDLQHQLNQGMTTLANMQGKRKTCPTCGGT